MLKRYIAVFIVAEFCKLLIMSKDSEL
jgi:hypothetical protein